MEQGTLGELYLTRSVTKHIRKYNKAVAVGAGVGKDYALIDCGKASSLETASIPAESDNAYISVSEGIAETPFVAWIKAINNIAMSGCDISGVRLSYMLPVDTTEEQLKVYAGEFNSLADGFGIQIIGGNTRVSFAYSRASFLVEVVGTLAADNRLLLKAKEDYEVVMVGYTAMLGTNLIVNQRCDELKTRFAPSYVEGSRFPDSECCILDRAKKACELATAADVVYMHDISHGGVYGALWQLGQALNMGVVVNHRSIPVKQETIEVCNYFDINPYMCDGTGAFLVVARDGKLLADELSKSGCVASVIGKLTNNKDRVVILGSESGEKRFLTPIKGDEIYKVISAY
ncbi:MAG: hypothetical protein J6A59_13650 [Lachnospiraceae bacterium]|nr:hypothetical protein [Lachnospiraceae bacterium]